MTYREIEGDDWSVSLRGFPLRPGRVGKNRFEQGNQVSYLSPVGYPIDETQCTPEKRVSRHRLPVGPGESGLVTTDPGVEASLTPVSSMESFVDPCPPVAVTGHVTHSHWVEKFGIFRGLLVRGRSEGSISDTVIVLQKFFSNLTQVKEDKFLRHYTCHLKPH